MTLHYIKPLAFRPDGPNRWKACGLQWSKRQVYVVDQSAGGMYVATIVMDGYRGYLGEKPNSVEASQLCQAHHEQELSEWLTPVPEASIEAASQTASPPEKNQQTYPFPIQTGDHVRLRCGMELGPIHVNEAYGYPVRFAFGESLIRDDVLGWNRGGSWCSPAEPHPADIVAIVKRTT